MWMVLGAAAIITAILNVLWAAQHKEAKWFRFCSLSFTALTVCDFYSYAAQKISVEDWGALIDVIPTMSKMLWLCVIASILINSISLFVKKER